MVKVNFQALAMAVLCLVVLVAPAVAIICESFQTRSQCDGTWTDAGQCQWNNGRCITSDVVLPVGQVAITEIGAPQLVELNDGAPSPEEE